MVLTNERAEILAKLIADKPEILECPIDEAMQKINANGYDFSIEELKEIDTILVESAKENDGELSEKSLDDVSGGVFWTAAKIVIKWGPKAYKAGYWIGTQIAKRM